MSDRQTISIGARRIQADGQTLQILEAGAGQPRLVLMVHGFPCYAGMWAKYLGALGGDYHTVALDLRGYNLSSKPRSIKAYRLHALSDDLLELVRALGHQEAYLVAHDWGGIIAWDAISRYPQTFTKAVIMNAPHPQIYAKLYVSDPDQMKKGRYTHMFRRFWAPWALRMGRFKLLREGMFQASLVPFTDDEQEGYIKAWRRGLKYPLAYYQANLPQMEDFKALPPTDVPTLVAWGEQDANLSLNNLAGLDAWVRNLEIKRYPDATHWLPHEKASELIQDIREFFARSSPQSSRR